MFRKNEVIGDRYTVLSIIGRGGMGCVYKVQDTALNEVVALKTLLPRFVQDRVVIERFFNEARITRQLSHPNIVRVHDIGTARKVVYISMEYIGGRSLREMLETLPPGERLPLRTALRMMEDLCNALDYAHEYTVHRDIKPENVMITESGTAKLMDFGISKLMKGGAATSTSMVMGTPCYMSPEQLRDSSRVDRRADIYSLGVMLYEILTGHLPVGLAQTPAQARNELPPALDPVVRKCLNPAPEKRFQTAGQLREALQPVRQLVESGGVREAGPSPVPAAVTWRRRKRQIAGLALCALTLCASGLGIVGVERNLREPGRAGTIATAETAHDSRHQLLSLVDRIRPIAEERAEGNRLMHAAVAAGRDWEAHAVGAQGEEADLAGRFALECYGAPLVWPSGMCFVHPGTVPNAAGEEVLLHGFFIDEHEVTNRAYERFRQKEEWRRPRGLENADPDWPVTSVTHYDAEAYAAWSGKSLPTDEQWSRAAYGGTPRRYPWDTSFKAGMSNVWDGGNAASPATVATHAEDRSVFGCYDMAGNVSERTRTVLPEDGRGRGEEMADDMPDFGRVMLVRGGNFTHSPEEAGLTVRFGVPYGLVSPVVGFRCVINLPESNGDLAKMIVSGSFSADSSG